MRVLAAFSFGRRRSLGPGYYPIRRGNVSLIFEPRDWWIGFYWSYELSLFSVYVCIVPMLPICVSWRRLVTR